MGKGGCALLVLLSNTSWCINAEYWPANQRDPQLDLAQLMMVSVVSYVLFFTPLSALERHALYVAAKLFLPWPQASSSCP